jgi:hypothetical protein
MDNNPEVEHPKRRSDVIFRPLDDSWVLFDPGTEQLHVLNFSAALVWEFADGETVLDGIAEAVGSAFDPPVSASQAMTDVRSVLERFQEAGLLDPSPQN